MGVFGFVLSGGGAAGVLLGGTLTELLSWHWIFLVNIPVGIAALLLCRVLLSRCGAAARGLDIAGAVTVTTSLMLAVYAIVNGNQPGWTSARDAGNARRRGRAAGRLPRDRVARRRTARCRSGSGRSATSRSANLIGEPLVGRDVRVVLPFCAVPPARARLQRTRGRVCLPARDPAQGRDLAALVGQARHALRDPDAADRRCSCGYLLALLLFARAPVDGNYFADVLPGMLALGIGVGITFNPSCWQR